MDIITVTEMADRTLLRLMTWLSPAFPVGAFSYSHGIERAIEEGLIGDRPTLVAWLRELVDRGSAWNDAVLLAESWRQAKSGDVEMVAELAEAMAGSKERHMETMLQGEAFLKALSAWAGEEDGTQARHPSSPPGNGEWLNVVLAGMPYPVAVGGAAARHGIALEPALIAYLHAFVSNIVQATVRLVPLGQSDGVAALAELEEIVLTAAGRAAASALDDLGSAAFMSEIMSMRHETQYSRVFRS
jgi:urease accessory protein